jgi:hypothetical protein
MLSVMATLKQKIECEMKVRQMLDEADVPPPDHIEYGYGCIRVFWIEPKVALVVDIDDVPNDLTALGLPSEFA